MHVSTTGGVPGAAVSGIAVPRLENCARTLLPCSCHTEQASDGFTVSGQAQRT